MSPSFILQPMYLPRRATAVADGRTAFRLAEPVTQQHQVFTRDARGPLRAHEPGGKSFITARFKRGLRPCVFIARPSRYDGTRLAVAKHRPRSSHARRSSKGFRRDNHYPGAVPGFFDLGPDGGLRPGRRFCERTTWYCHRSSALTPSLDTISAQKFGSRALTDARCHVDLECTRVDHGDRPPTSITKDDDSGIEWDMGRTDRERPDRGLLRPRCHGGQPRLRMAPYSCPSCACNVAVHLRV